MAAEIIISKAFGNGEKYDCLFLSGTGFTAAGTIAASSITITGGTCIHAAITIDAAGAFTEEQVYLPRILTRGTKTITVTDSGSKSDTETFTVQKCQVTTSENVGRYNNWSKLGAANTWFDDASSPTTEQMEQHIARIEDEFIRETGYPIKPIHIRKYIDTNGQDVTQTYLYPIKAPTTYINPISVRYWKGNDWQSATSYDYEPNDSVIFWYDNIGNFHWEEDTPSEKYHGLYVDVYIGYDIIPGDIVTAIEARTGSVLENSQSYVKLTRRLDEQVDPASRRDYRDKIWKDCLARYRRLRRVDYYSGGLI